MNLGSCDHRITHQLRPIRYERAFNFVGDVYFDFFHGFLDREEQSQKTQNLLGKAS